MKDNIVSKLNLSEEVLYNSAEKRCSEGDYLGALKMLHKRNELYGPGADAQALYADCYEQLELWELAADAWFRFLDICNEADFGEAYEGLGVCFMNMGNEMLSAFYYNQALGDDEYDPNMSILDFHPMRPEVHIVRGKGEPDPETLQEGLTLLKIGDLEAARDRLSEMDETSPDYPTAAGLAAMCTLMLDDEKGAEKECERLLKLYPTNIQVLTTYCAVLSGRGDTEGAKRAARRLYELDVDGNEDLYRIATALCETGMHAEAFDVLSRLRERQPYDHNTLWFYAVAAKNLGKIDESISALEMITLLDPRKAVAQFYLERMRALRDGEGEDFPMTYYYRVPEEEYRTVADFLLTASQADERTLERMKYLPRLDEFFHIAFDEMEGRDRKLMTLAIKTAERMRADNFLREILLDFDCNEFIKISVLHEIATRNEDDSFGTVLLNTYREFFTHTIEIGEKKKKEFMRGFADVYAKYAIIDAANEGKICAAGEDVYHTLEEAGAWELMDDRRSLSAAIYREARVIEGVHGLEKITEIFHADIEATRRILDFMI